MILSVHYYLTTELDRSLLHRLNGRGGSRTHTTFYGQRILSPSCLPFHHSPNGSIIYKSGSFGVEASILYILSVNVGGKNKIGGTGIRTQDNGFANRGLSPLGDAAALLSGFYNTIKGNVRQEVFSYPHNISLADVISAG